MLYWFLNHDGIVSVVNKVNFKDMWKKLSGLPFLFCIIASSKNDHDEMNFNVTWSL